MAKVLVLYQSRTGNTEKMALAVAEGARRISGIEVRTKAVSDATRQDVKWCDGLALGSPTQMGTVAWEMKRFWDDEMRENWSKLDGRIGCAFSSQGGYGGGAELTCQALCTILINFGFLVFGLPDYTAPGFTLHYGATVAGQPQEDKEIEACRRLGQRLAEWVAALIEGRREEHPLRSDRQRFPWA